MGFIEKLLNFVNGNIEEEKEEAEKGIIEENEKIIEKNISSDSIILEIEKMKQKVMAIEITNKEKGEEIKRKIELFESKIKENTDSEETLKQEFQTFKHEFNEELKEAEKRYIFIELDILNKELEKLMWKENLSEDKSIELDYLNKNLKVLTGKKDILESERKQAYLVELIKANYRIQCLNYINDFRQSSFNPLSDTEKIIFATLVKEDMMSFYEQLSEVKYKYMMRDVNYEDIERVEKELDNFVRRMGIQYSETMDLTNFFDDTNMQESFIDIMKQVRNKVIYADRDIKTAKEKRKKELEEQIKLKELEDKRKEQQEKYKKMTEEEMKKEIEEIDDAIFDKKQSYINILEFERKVAETRGLLDKNNTLDVDDMEKVRVSLESIISAVLRANKLGINYVALLDIDDNEKNNLLVFPKGYRRTLLKEIEEKNGFGFRSVEGTYNNAFIEYVMGQESKNIGYYRGELYVYYPERKEILKLYEELEEGKLDKNMVDGIKVGLRMSYLRPLVPILEKLKETGIEYYIPPIDDEAKRRTMNKQIYIDRKDLEKYKELVHPNISTEELGKIEIFSEDINLSKIILDGVKIDFIEEIREKKKQQEEKKKKREELKKLDDKDIRKEIKRIDDKSFDVTTSYKNILEYQKMVASAKGLLDEKSGMDTEDIAYKRTSKDLVVALMKNADKKGIAYTVLLDIDNCVNKNCMIIASKQDIDKINGSYEYVSSRPNGLIRGKYGKSFIYLLQSEGRGEEINFDINGNAYRYDMFKVSEDKCEAEIRKMVKDIKKLDNREKMKDVKCYLEFSYQRPIISILEALKKEGIEYYIPPVDYYFNKVEPTMKIYIDRKDVKKYKENVHSKISNSDNGIIKLAGDDLTYLDLALEGTDSPYIERKEERQK